MTRYVKQHTRRTRSGTVTVKAYTASTSMQVSSISKVPQSLKNRLAKRAGDRARKIRAYREEILSRRWK